MGFVKLNLANRNSTKLNLHKIIIIIEKKKIEPNSTHQPLNNQFGHRVGLNSIELVG